MADTIPYAPDQSGYSIEDGAGVVSTQLDGGGAVYRRDIINPRATATIQWTRSADQISQLKVFLRVREAEPFIVPLIFEGDTSSDHECRLIPGSVRTTRLNGPLRTLQAQVEVDPVATTGGPSDRNLLIGYLGSEAAGKSFLDALNTLVNVDAAGALS